MLVVTITIFIDYGMITIVFVYSGTSQMNVHVCISYIAPLVLKSMNHNSLATNTHNISHRLRCKNGSRPMRRTHFCQYQASLAALG